MSAGPTSIPALDRADVWQRQVVYWHGLFAALLGVAALLMVLDTTTPRTVPLLCLAGITAAYAVLGAPALRREDERLGAWYLAAAWPLLLVIFGVRWDGDFYFLSFGLFPQTWALLRRRAAAWTTVGVVTASSLLRVAVTPPSTDSCSASL